MMVFDLFKTAAAATTGVKGYGHGSGSYFNMEKEKFPCIWLYPVITNGERSSSSSISSATKPIRHDMLVSVVDLCDFSSATSEAIEAVLTRMYPMAIEFFLRMCKSSGFAGSTKFRMEEIIHGLDENTVGYAIRFDLAIVEDVTYPCS